MPVTGRHSHVPSVPVTTISGSETDEAASTLNTSPCLNRDVASKLPASSTFKRHGSAGATAGSCRPSRQRHPATRRAGPSDGPSRNHNVAGCGASIP